MKTSMSPEWSEELLGGDLPISGTIQPLVSESREARGTRVSRVLPPHAADPLTVES